jgi:hypothetical protein
MAQYNLLEIKYRAIGTNPLSFNHTILEDSGHTGKTHSVTATHSLFQGNLLFDSCLPDHGENGFEHGIRPANIDTTH